MESEKEQKVLEAAQVVFERHGFRRVTMQDVANEAGISRPALYLIYPNKEEIFKAAALRMGGAILAELRASLPTLPTVQAQLSHAFELWSVRTFEMMLNSPDARDIIECSQGFARETIHQISSQFEELLVRILEPLIPPSAKPPLPLTQIARLLVASTHGFKEAATTAAELRALIAGQLTLTLAALQPKPIT
jgi:AcrR family transcriptional regulator